MAVYRLPERVQIHYVSYPLSNYLACAQLEMDKTTEPDGNHRGLPRADGSNYFGEATTPTAAKEKIRGFSEAGMYNGGQGRAEVRCRVVARKSRTRRKHLSRWPRNRASPPQLTAPFSVEAPPAGPDV